MQRAIVTPVDLAATALGELKDWLAITSTREDAALLALLQASLETCEAFTRQVPVDAEFEEIVPRGTGWNALATRPVRAITSVEAVADDGSRSGIDVGSYLLDLGFDGVGRLRVTTPIQATRFAVRFSAGIAADWESLPGGLRHGMIRLAAHNFRQRESAEESHPPAAITALWRPWREMRLA